MNATGHLRAAISSDRGMAIHLIYLLPISL
jgi:hypothetical protein